MPGFYSPEWWKVKHSEDPHDCTVEQLEKAILGYFTADALPLSYENKPGLSGRVRVRRRRWGEERRGT